MSRISNHVVSFFSIFFYSICKYRLIIIYVEYMNTTVNDNDILSKKLDVMDKLANPANLDMDSLFRNKTRTANNSVSYILPLPNYEFEDREFSLTIEGDRDTRYISDKAVEACKLIFIEHYPKYYQECVNKIENDLSVPEEILYVEVRMRLIHAFVDITSYATGFKDTPDGTIARQYKFPYYELVRMPGSTGPQLFDTLDDRVDNTLLYQLDVIDKVANPANIDMETLFSNPYPFPRHNPTVAYGQKLLNYKLRDRLFIIEIYDRNYTYIRPEIIEYAKFKFLEHYPGMYRASIEHLKSDHYNPGDLPQEIETFRAEVNVHDTYLTICLPFVRLDLLFGATITLSLSWTASTIRFGHTRRSGRLKKNAWNTRSE
jgi:hypothetical protein